MTTPAIPPDITATGPAPRRDRLPAADAAVVDRMIRLALAGLPEMQNADGTACHTRNFTADHTGHTAHMSNAGNMGMGNMGNMGNTGGGRDGRSLRYTAIVLLGARHLDADAQRA